MRPAASLVGTSQHGRSRSRSRSPSPSLQWSAADNSGAVSSRNMDLNREWERVSNREGSFERSDVLRYREDGSSSGASDGSPISQLLTEAETHRRVSYGGGDARYGSARFRV